MRARCEYARRAPGCSTRIAMGRVLVLAFFSCVRFLTAADGPSPAPWEVLDKALQSGEVEHRQQTVVALSTLGAGNEMAVKRIEDMLRHDKSPRVRQQAALVLGRMKAKQSIPVLKEALQDGNEVAFAAAKALLDLGDDAGQDMLVDILTGDR